MPTTRSGTTTTPAAPAPRPKRGLGLVQRPGLGRPLRLDLQSKKRFPSALAIYEGWHANTIGTRERAMLWFVDYVTDKPGWNKDVFDDAAVAKWKEEVADAVHQCEVELAAAKEVADASAAARRARHKAEWAVDHPDNDEFSDFYGSDESSEDEDIDYRELTWTEQWERRFAEQATKHMERPYTPVLARGFTELMFDYCIRELRDKAKIYDTTGTVSVCDGAAAAFKSDTAVPPELRTQLLEATKDLESRIRPGTGGRVRALVDPSMYPLVYGKTRVLRDRTLTLDTCLQAYGSGEVVPAPEVIEVKDDIDDMYYSSNKHLVSSKFQWLPCEVDITNGARFTSYINNLHPVKHAAVYRATEAVLAKALPMLGAMYDRVMTWDSHWSEDQEYVKDLSTLTVVLRRSRMALTGLGHKCEVPDICEKAAPRGCRFSNLSEVRHKARIADLRAKLSPEEAAKMDDKLVMRGRDCIEGHKWFKRTHPPILEEPRPYEFVGYSDYKMSGPWFRRKNIQVIVKLTDIELTPDNPSYPGGHWHVEGVLNERICGTALYYYDVDNITESRLAFRTFANAEDMQKNISLVVNDMEEFEAFYDFDRNYEGPILTHIGSVRAQQGRLLVFPNVYQHRIEPFELADKTRPGRRRILAIFLVDPHEAIISTANVPPQQRDWAGLSGVDTLLPREIANKVYDDVGCPYDDSTALAIREELAQDRSRIDTSSVNVIKSAACCRQD